MSSLKQQVAEEKRFQAWAASRGLLTAEAKLKLLAHHRFVDSDELGICAKCGVAIADPIHTPIFLEDVLEPSPKTG